jgi:hypothetical protein
MGLKMRRSVKNISVFEANKELMQHNEKFKKVLAEFRHNEDIRYYYKHLNRRSENIHNKSKRKLKAVGNKYFEKTGNHIPYRGVAYDREAFRDKKRERMSVHNPKAFSIPPLPKDYKVSRRVIVPKGIPYSEVVKSLGLDSDSDPLPGNP